MAADIISAKKELYNLLKSQEEIKGAGIKGSGKSEHIVIFVSKLSASVKKVIPASFKGIKVKTEKKEVPKPVAR